MDLVAMASMDVASPDAMRRLQEEVSKQPQYEPETRHFFHGGMYCREVWRNGGVLVVGKVHRKEHFYLIVSGRVRIGAEEFGPGALILSKPGTKRAVLSLEPTLCMTFHRTDATTVEEAERELVEEDENDMYLPGNRAKPQEVLK